MAKFIKLALGNGQEILINADQISSVSPYGGGGILLRLASPNEKEMFINMSFDDFYKLLQEG